MQTMRIIRQDGVSPLLASRMERPQLRDVECFLATEVDSQIIASKEMGTLILQQQGTGIWQNVNELRRRLHQR